MLADSGFGQAASLVDVAGLLQRLTITRLSFIAHGENTTFRVDSGDARFLMRVHRPNRHSPGVDSQVAVGSELDWLAALQADTDLSVPTPIRARSGQWTTVADGRVCSILGWQGGRMQDANPRSVHFRRLGGVLAPFA